MTSYQVETVSSGEFYVGRQNSKLLKAFLGSCVGVVLVDEKSGVAGLYHILLPEPPAKGSVEEPEKYASTGMPLFMEALYKSGAKKENLAAYVGGGALVGHVSLLDLKLDIGGQTAEVVEKYLGLEGVDLKQVETGGYLSSQISLDMYKLTCVIEPIIAQHILLEETEVEHKYVDVEQAFQGIRPIPQIALKVIRMIHSPSASLSNIANEIRTDQVLVAKVLQLSNSAYLNVGKKIESIDNALVYLGEKRILLLSLTVFSELFYQQAEQGYSLIKGGLYRHALGVAFIAEKIALLTKSVLPDHAYTAGLLHDIGKTVLDQFLAADYPLFYRKVTEDSKRSLLDLEKELFGFDHGELGKRLAEKWTLPPGLVDAIAYHHCPDKAQDNPVLTHVTYLANTLFSAFRSGVSLAVTDAISMADSLKAVNLLPGDLKGLIDQIPWNRIDKIDLT